MCQNNVIFISIIFHISTPFVFPKQGFGNTNDGNTARRAFEQSKTFSEITGVDVDIISRLKTVLKAVCSEYDLDSSSFQLYCNDTTNKIFSEDNWYVIPPTVHKPFEHSLQIQLEFIQKYRYGLLSKKL